MKHWILLVLCVVISSAASAQVDSTKTDSLEISISPKEGVVIKSSDTVRINTQGKEIIIVDHPEWDDDDDDDDDSWEFSGGRKPHHWGGIGIGVGGYLSEDKSFNLPDESEFMENEFIRSLDWNFNFEHGVPLVGQKFKFVTGAGLGITSYGIEADVTLLPGGDELRVVPFDSLQPGATLRKNKLTTFWINVPLLLAVNTGDRHRDSFHFSAGLVAGLRVGTRYKQKWKVDGATVKQKTSDDFHLNDVRFSLRTQIGFGRFNLYATYSLTQLFEDGEGPELYPFTVGIQVISF